MAYLLDFRKRALEFIDDGGTQEEAAGVFGVTTRTLSDWIRRRKKGELEKTPRRSSPTKIDNEKLKQYIQQYPDAYLREIAEEFGSTVPAVFYACKRLKLSLKKNPYYKERDEAERKKFAEEIEKIPKNDRVYVDESGINEYLQRKHAREKPSLFIHWKKGMLGFA